MTRSIWLQRELTLPRLLATLTDAILFGGVFVVIGSLTTSAGLNGLLTGGVPGGLFMGIYLHFRSRRPRYPSDVLADRIFRVPPGTR